MKPEKDWEITGRNTFINPKDVEATTVQDENWQSKPTYDTKKGKK